MVELNKRFSRSGIQYGELVSATVSEEAAIKTGLTRQHFTTDKGSLNDA